MAFHWSGLGVPWWIHPTSLRSIPLAVYQEMCGNCWQIIDQWMAGTQRSLIKRLIRSGEYYNEFIHKVWDQFPLHFVWRDMEITKGWWADGQKDGQMDEQAHSYSLPTALRGTNKRIKEIKWEHAEKIETYPVATCGNFCSSINMQWYFCIWLRHQWKRPADRLAQMVWYSRAGCGGGMHQRHTGVHKQESGIMMGRLWNDNIICY